MVKNSAVVGSVGRFLIKDKMKKEPGKKSTKKPVKKPYTDDTLSPEIFVFAVILQLMTSWPPDIPLSGPKRNPHIF